MLKWVRDLPRHPRRFWRGGVPIRPKSGAKRVSMTPVDRFWSKVNKDGPTQPHMTTPCWVWTGAVLQQSGYGEVKWTGRIQRVHRVSWCLTGKILPVGALVLHHCDNRVCVRPEHLYIGTHKDNYSDMVTRGRWHALVGTAAPHAKLDETAVREIRRKYTKHSRTAGSGALAQEYGVERSTVLLLIKGCTWRSVK